jgi:predicted PurR-regulated permease PerM
LWYQAAMPFAPQLPLPRLRAASFDVRELAYGLIVAAIVVAALIAGRDFLIPIALTTLITFMLAPLVDRLRRLIGRVPAVLVVVSLTTALIAGVAFVLAWQVLDFAGDLDRYKGNLQQKIESLRGQRGEGSLIDRATAVVRELADDLASPRSSTPAGPDAGQTPQRPMPVTIDHGGPASAYAAVTAFLGPLLSPVLTAGLVIVLVAFMLLEREQLTDRLIRLVSRGDISRTTEAIGDAATRMSRYLHMLLMIDVAFGAYVAIGLWLIGMPNPLLWGVLAAVLRLIPYAGAVIAAIIPAMVGLAAEPGWTLPLMVLAVILVGEVIVGQVVEPLLYGSSTGISSLAILVAMVFWGVVWGPIGMVLATPLTVCLGVVGRYVPHLEFLGVLLADEPALPTEAKVYHRLLARAPQDAVEIAVDHAEAKGVIDLFDHVMLPMLNLAELDRRRDALDNERQKLIVDGVADIVGGLEGLPDVVLSPDSDEGEPEKHHLHAAQDDIDRRLAAEDQNCDPLALCVGGRGELDRAAAILVAELLRRRHVPATVSAVTEFGRRVAAREAEACPRVAVLCFNGTVSSRVIEHVARRVRLENGSAIALVVLTTGGGGTEGNRVDDILPDIPVAADASSAVQVALDVIRRPTTPSKAA